MTKPIPGQIDLHIGAKMRARRKAIGMTQSQLADQLSLTFQQVQKYERGVNRVSAAMLLLAAKALGVPITYFYEGLGGVEGAPEAGKEALFLAAKGSNRLMDAFVALDTRSQQVVVGLAHDLARDHRLTRDGQALEEVA